MNYSTNFGFLGLVKKKHWKETGVNMRGIYPKPVGYYDYVPI